MILDLRPCHAIEATDSFLLFDLCKTGGCGCPGLTVVNTFWWLRLLLTLANLGVASPSNWSVLTP